MKRINERDLSKHAEVGVIFNGVSATETNEKILVMIEQLEKIAESNRVKADFLYGYWLERFNKYKSIIQGGTYSEDQRLSLHDATVRCAVLDHVLNSKPINISHVRDLKMV